MDSTTLADEKEKDLLKQKEILLQEIKYYEKRAEYLKNNPICRYDLSSSDSEDDMTTLIETGPSLAQLKLERSMRNTCLQATEELTNLKILQSETKMIDEPVLVGETPVKEAGTWREVIAECRIDLVPFCITFYTHTPNRKFAPTWFRSLCVTLIKASHKAELDKSVLPTVKKPSEAIAVLKQYSTASRSRKNTLAHLADVYETSLYMQPMDDGGFLLKCENVLEMSWRLENRRSPFSPFHHRMKLDLEYMEEKYIKEITQIYDQLPDPTITTSERTELLSEIISICLKAKESLSETAESAPDDEKESSRNDDGVMAPPKTVPRRSKSKTVKGVHESVNNTSGSLKRVIDDASDSGNFGQCDTNTIFTYKQTLEGNTQRAADVNKSKQTQRTGPNVGGTSKSAPGKRNRPTENIEPTVNTADGNTKRNKTDENKILNKNSGVLNKESSNTIKKHSTKNNQAIEKNQKQVIKSTSGTKESGANSAGRKLVENVAKETKNVAVLKSKTSTNGIPVNKLKKDINNAKTDNKNKQKHGLATQLTTNKEQIISGSGDRLKRIDTPKRFNNKKPMLPLKIQNNRKSLTKIRKSVGKQINNKRIEKENARKISKIPQKLMSHSSGSLNNQKFKSSSKLSLYSNTRKVPSSIPRLTKPSTSKQ